MVILNENGAFVKSEFAKINFIWHDLMTSMLGNTYKVLSKFSARNDSEIIALPSPDGSQNGQWYFPKSAITKIGTLIHILLPTFLMAAFSWNSFRIFGSSITTLICQILVMDSDHTKLTYLNRLPDLPSGRSFATIICHFSLKKI